MGTVGLMCVGVQMGELVTEAQWYRLMTGKGEPLARTCLVGLGYQGTLLW